MGNTCFGVCACIDQASIGVVERWGRFDKLAQPGLHFLNPLAGECLTGVLSTRIQSLDVRIETKTKVIKMNAADAFYELQNPKEQIQAYVFDVVRALVPRMNLDELFEKGEVARAVLEELEKIYAVVEDAVPSVRSAACRAIGVMTSFPKAIHKIQKLLLVLLIILGQSILRGFHFRKLVATEMINGNIEEAC